MTDDGTVVYTTKELLARIDSKIDALHLSLNTKASQQSVDHLDIRVERLEADVNQLKTSRAQLMAFVGMAMFVIPLLVAVAFHYT